MPTTSVVLFTRDLRVHDHPALAAASRDADRVVPLFVLDEAIVASRYAAPNRVAFLLGCLRDLRRSLRDCGGRLLIRRGHTIDVVRSICTEVAPSSLHVSTDVSRYARRREEGLRRLAADLGLGLHMHDGVTIAPPGELTTTSGSHFSVFTAYWRRWQEHPRREPIAVPVALRTPTTLPSGRLPALAELVDGARSPHLPPGGEAPGRALASGWFEHGIAGYDDGRDDLAGDRTSRLSPYLHFGCVSPLELDARIDRGRRGHEAFQRQLCWRDFNHQLAAAVPDIARRPIRPRPGGWRDDDEAVQAWKQGRTGYPLVDAGMRQLLTEGWMHNRVRMVAASFLTKHLLIDWRVGAQYFLDWLVDGDIANNSAQWQWIAGTGTDTRPNRLYNPVVQSRRFDPDGHYLRRHLPELRPLPASRIHAPWEHGHDLDYPPPIVVLDEARDRFLAVRGGRSSTLHVDTTVPPGS